MNKFGRGNRFCELMEALVKGEEWGQEMSIESKGVEMGRVPRG